jgi:hypothetical protein
MGKKEITRIGWLVFTGLIIQIITSRFFMNLIQPYNSYMTVRDFICLFGQNIGEFFYAVSIWFILKKVGFFRAVVEFWLCLLIIDSITLIFLNPYELSLPKDSGFIFGGIILLIRIKKYFGASTADT